MWQRGKDFADVIKVPNQLSLSQLKGRLSCVGQAKTGEPLKERLKETHSLPLTLKKQVAMISTAARK